MKAVRYNRQVGYILEVHLDQPATVDEFVEYITGMYQNALDNDAIQSAEIVIRDRRPVGELDYGIGLEPESPDLISMGDPTKPCDVHVVRKWVASFEHFGSFVSELERICKE